MDYLQIIPNQLISLDISEDICQLIGNAEDGYIARIALEDFRGFGVILPAKFLRETSCCTFTLPEQLCIFSPDETYLCKLEILIDTALIVPVIKEAQITLGDSAEPEDNEPDAVEAEVIQTPARPLVGSPIESDEELDALLDVIAPLPKRAPKAKVEDIVRQLDEEFVRAALWNQPESGREQQTEMAPVPVRVPEPSIISPESESIKQKMKSLLRGMLS